MYTVSHDSHLSNKNIVMIKRKKKKIQIQKKVAKKKGRDMIGRDSAKIERRNRATDDRANKENCIHKDGNGPPRLKFNIVMLKNRICFCHKT